MRKPTNSRSNICLFNNHYKENESKEEYYFILIVIYTQFCVDLYEIETNFVVFVEFNWLGYRTTIWSSRKFENSGKIWIRTRERSWQRNTVFFPLPSSPPSPRISSTIVEVSYIFTHALSGYVSWLHRYLVNVTVDLPWKRILLPNGAGWGNGGTLKRDLGL